MPSAAAAPVRTQPTDRRAAAADLHMSRLTEPFRSSRAAAVVAVSIPNPTEVRPVSAAWLQEALVAEPQRAREAMEAMAGLVGLLGLSGETAEVDFRAPDLLEQRPVAAVAVVAPEQVALDIAEVTAVQTVVTAAALVARSGLAAKAAGVRDMAAGAGAELALLEGPVVPIVKLASLPVPPTHRPGMVGPMGPTAALAT